MSRHNGHTEEINRAPASNLPGDLYSQKIYHNQVTDHKQKQKRGVVDSLYDMVQSRYGQLIIFAILVVIVLYCVSARQNTEISIGGFSDASDIDPVFLPDALRFF